MHITVSFRFDSLAEFERWAQAGATPEHVPVPAPTAAPVVSPCASGLPVVPEPPFLPTTEIAKEPSF